MGEVKAGQTWYERDHRFRADPVLVVEVDDSAGFVTVTRGRRTPKGTRVTTRVRYSNFLARFRPARDDSTEVERG